MNHPGATVGFRIETPHFRFGYITDNEFLSGYLGDPCDVHADSPILLPFKKIVDFVSGVDLLITEAQYPNEEYARKVGWGHSSLSNACILVQQAGVRRWIITHHDPQHDDEALDRKLNLTRQILKSMGHTCEVSHAYDGMSQPM
jgi:phosphoribosyl 1,2-cyclic phosphodiesterase